MMLNSPHTESHKEPVCGPIIAGYLGEHTRLGLTAFAVDGRLS